MNDAFLDRDQYYLESFLAVLDKKNCLQTGMRIKDAFGLGIKYKHKTAPLLQSKAFQAVGFLKYQDIKKEILKHQDLIKMLEKLQAALSDIVEYKGDPQIMRYLQNRALTLDELPISEASFSYQNVLSDIKRLRLKLALLLHDGRKTTGRPSLAEFYAYVLAVIKLFIEVSETKFTIDRYKEGGEKNKGQYTPLTLGHKFVSIATDYVNCLANERGVHSIYTPSNIYNACEEAQILIKNNSSDKL